MKEKIHRKDLALCLAQSKSFGFNSFPLSWEAFVSGSLPSAPLLPAAPPGPLWAQTPGMVPPGGLSDSERPQSAFAGTRVPAGACI